MRAGITWPTSKHIAIRAYLPLVPTGAGGSMVEYGLSDGSFSMKNRNTMSNV